MKNEEFIPLLASIKTFFISALKYSPHSSFLILHFSFNYSTVTDFAKFLGWSTSMPLHTAM